MILKLFSLPFQLVAHSPGGVATIEMVPHMDALHSPSNIPPIVYEDDRIVILVFGRGVAARRQVPIKLDHHHHRPPKIIIHIWMMLTVRWMRRSMQSWIGNRYVREIHHIKIRPTVSVVRWVRGNDRDFLENLGVKFVELDRTKFLKNIYTFL